MTSAEQRGPSSGGAYIPLSQEEAHELSQRVPGWTLKDKDLERQFQFKDFRQAMDFVRGVADAAEKRDHHPDIFISYNKVRLTLTTHKTGGLTKRDFDLAGDIDRLPGA